MKLAEGTRSGFFAAAPKGKAGRWTPGLSSIAAAVHADRE
jgi:hypothetical protein